MFDRLYYKNDPEQKIKKFWAEIGISCVDWKRKCDILNEIFDVTYHSDRKYRGHYGTYFKIMKDNDLLIHKYVGRKGYYKLNPNSNGGQAIRSFLRAQIIDAIEETL